jgi:hypothetical protein
VSGGNISKILRLWSASLLQVNPNASGPYRSHTDLYQTIDQSNLADVLWESFAVCYQGPEPRDGPVPAWMTTDTEIWFRDPRQLIHNIISSPDFVEEIDWSPYHEYVGNIHDKENHRFHDFFSGDWVWKQAVRNYPF